MEAKRTTIEASFRPSGEDLCWMRVIGSHGCNSPRVSSNRSSHFLGIDAPWNQEAGPAPAVGWAARIPTSVQFLCLRTLSPCRAER